MEDFARAEAWLRERKRRLAMAHPGAYIYLNAADLTYAIDTSHNSASDAYTQFYRRCRRHKGKIPRRGWYIIGWQIPET
ncbi:MAG: hypothetical protein KBE09_05705 [Candidatus Pacebacteria bacterium]|nr:hypothetical protein [Candidatus Paceibacterota bacterium]